MRTAPSMGDATGAPLPSDAAAACLNCGHAFTPQRLNFCPACGQDTNIKPPTLREFAQQFGGSYIAVEGALWRSLKLVLFKPGVLTREYLAGRRRQYVLPLRLYLTVSMLVLLLLQLVAVVDVGGLEKSLAEKPPREMHISVANGRAGLKDGVFFCTDLPAWVCGRLKARITLDSRGMVEQVKQSTDRVRSHAGAAMFVLLPAFAFFFWVAYWNRRLRYTEHLVFALHVHVFWFVMLGLMLLGQDWLTGIAALLTPIYTLLAMRRVYGGRWWPRLLRAAVISVLYGIALFGCMTAIALWAFLS
jgi:Protein of unknown function (DUF3667)